MDVEILNERENPLLGRREVKFRVKYPGVGVPNRQDVRGRLVAFLNSSKELTVLDYLKPEYGRHSALGYVKVYENPDAMKVEAEYKIKRNFEVKQKKEEAPAAEVPKEEKGEKPEEEKKEVPKEGEKGEK